MKKTLTAIVIIGSMIGALLNISMGPSQVEAVSAGTNTLINPGFEQAWTADQTTANGWSTYQGGFTRTSETAHSGTYSAKATNTGTTGVSGTFQRIDLNQTTMAPVFIGGYVKGSNITAAANSYFGASIYAEIHLASGKTVYWNTAMNTGTFDWRWIGFNTASLPTVNEPISYIYIIGILGNASGTAYFDDMTAQTISPAPQGAVTVMFDDGNTTDYTIAKPTLDAYQMKASTAIITGEIGQDGTLTWSQIKALSQDGWEVVSHTVTHEDLRTLTATQLDAELKNSQSALKAEGYPATNLALPYGAYDGTVLAAASKYYSSIRTFETGTNPAGSYPYTIKIEGVLDTTTVADVQNWLNYAKQNKVWTVIVFHSLSTTGDDAYHIDPTTFKSMIKAIANSGVNIVTYGQGAATYDINASDTPTQPVVPPTPPVPTPGSTVGSISGILWNDGNANGVYDSTETPTPDRVVFMDKNVNGILDAGETQTTSDVNGKYTFSNLGADTYRISRVFPAGYHMSNSSTGYITVSLASGQNVTTVNIGSASNTTTVTPPSTSQTGSISGTLWNDADKDGVYDSNETPTPNRVVFMDKNANGILDAGEKQVYSDANGKYSFTGLSADTYRISRVFPAGYGISNSKNVYITVTVAAGQNVTNVNIGSMSK